MQCLYRPRSEELLVEQVGEEVLVVDSAVDSTARLEDNTLKLGICHKLARHFSTFSFPTVLHLLLGVAAVRRVVHSGLLLLLLVPAIGIAGKGSHKFGNQGSEFKFIADH